MEIVDRDDGHVSVIVREYRVLDGQARLYVGRDRRVWLGYRTDDGYSYIGDLSDNEKISKENACRAAGVF